MSRRRPTLWIVLIVAVGFAGWRMIPRENVPAAPRPEVADLEQAAVPSVPEPPVQAGPRVTPPAPLPPWDMPLGELVATLRPRADAGDPRAACRLAAELLRCARNDTAIEVHRRYSSFGSETYDKAGKLDIANRMDEQLVRRLELQIQCRAVPAEVLARGGDYLAQAARAGEPEAMIRYAIGEQWELNFDDVLANPGFDAWRRDAPAMLHRAVVAGAPEAVFLLYAAYSDDFSPYTGLVDDDRVQAQAYRMLFLRLQGRAEWVDRNLDAASVQQARDLAATWHRRYYDNRLIAAADIHLKPLYDAGVDGKDPGFCKPPPAPPDTRR